MRSASARGKALSDMVGVVGELSACALLAAALVWICMPLLMLLMALCLKDFVCPSPLAPKSIGSLLFSISLVLFSFTPFHFFQLTKQPPQPW